MIYKLQRKFILISTISIMSVVIAVFVAMVLFNFHSINKTMDILADSVSEGGGRFPASNPTGPKPGSFPPQQGGKFDFITSETPFSTRHFTVFFDPDGTVVNTYTDSIYTISQKQAVEYGRQVLTENRERGWLSNFRYKVFSVKEGTGVVFVDGSVNRAMLMQSMTIAGVVLLSCATMVLVLIILLSKRAVKPIAESYEKQKQFITDAGHELKTPLTLILANLDIAEEELGKNEWLGDIRSEGNRMTELVNQLVALSRMDEEGNTLNLSSVALGQMVMSTIAEFEPLADSRGKKLVSDVDGDIVLTGDEALLQRLLGILLDNAIKYCDQGGQISVSLYAHRQVVLTVENTYAALAELELNRLFDRFYRADKARTFTGGYGIGLSMAKAIVQHHGGDITAYKKDDTHIGFRVTI